jgi:hypothetical protein
MNINSLDQEIKKIKSELREITALYTEAISNKDYEKRSFYEEKIKAILTELKMKTIVYEDLKKQKATS